MKALILNAGYGTRLYPLTLNFPKGLLQIGKKRICDYILEKVKEVGIREVFLITNARFYNLFKDWGEKNGVKVIHDGTQSPHHRLGAIRDLELALKEFKIQESLLVLAGDNLYTFSLKGLVKRFQELKEEKFVAGLLEIKDKERIKKYGVVKVDEKGKIIKFEEKPEKPFSNLASIGIYAYPGSKLHLISEYLGEGNNPDAPGYFMEWLSKREEVYTFIFKEGKWYDIGNRETLEMAKKEFGEEGG